MKKVLSLLLFVVIVLGMSMPLYAGELKMRNSFNVKMSNLDRGTYGESLSLGSGSQLHIAQTLATRGSYMTEPGFSINWWLQGMKGGWGYDATAEDNELNWKALYGKWDAERFSVSAGYLGVMVGNGYNLQAEATPGIQVSLKPTMNTTLSLLAVLDSENAADDEEANPELLSDDDLSEDAWYYAAELTQKFDGGKASIYYLMKDYPEESNQTLYGGDDSLSSLGVSGSYKFKGINFKGEAATFFGDKTYTQGLNTFNEDYTGMFVTLGAMAPISDVFQVEANLYYSSANDDADKTGAYQFKKLGMVQPLQQGLGPVLDHDDSNLQLMSLPTNIMEITQDCGSYALGLSGQYKANQKTTLNAGLIYAMPEDKDVAATFSPGPGAIYTGWESLTKLNASVVYAVSKSLTTGLGASYITFSDNGADLENMYGATAFMEWSF
ncbi:hypothetical protein OAH46_03935 [Verrucomicrobia bacterium]|nr:hypothetical protein [Verrucomicrobiota bacterium]